MAGGGGDDGAGASRSVEVPHRSVHVTAPAPDPTGTKGEAMLGVRPGLGGWEVRTTTRMRWVSSETMELLADRVHLEPERMAFADCCLLVDEAGAISGIERP